MLDDYGNARERWNAVEKLLQGWLKERRDMLVSYAGIAGAFELTSQPGDLEPRLQQLCEILVDYVSAGHFEVFYELILEAEAFADGSDKLASSLIAQIGDTTEVILGFDEKYPSGNAEADYQSDLSLLGEILERRFELEDQLIVGLHKAHAVLLSQS